MSHLTEPDLPPNLACLKNVDALLRCPICFEYLDISMMTKCSHNFCSLCIRRFLSYKLQCPVCNSATTEFDLRNNRLLDELIRSFWEARQEISQIKVDSPPISPKTPRRPAKAKALKPGLQKDCSILSHFFQKRQPAETRPARRDETRTKEQPEEVPCSVKEEPEEVPSSGSPGSAPVPAPVPSTPSTSQDKKPLEKVDCPVCSVSVSQLFINQHLDGCLSRDSKKESLRSASSKRQPLAKLVYTLLSAQELKRRLRDLHLSTKGSRDQLVRRHQDFVHMYNAQCDALNPKSVEEIAKEIETNEKMRAQLEKTSSKAMVFSKNQTEEEMQELRSNYCKQHSAAFSRLIAQVRGHSARCSKVQREVKQEVKEDEEEAGTACSTVLTREDLKNTKQYLFMRSSDSATEEKPVTSAASPRSPSPAPSQVSLSSSVSDVFSPESDRSHENKPSRRKRRASSSKVKATELPSSTCTLDKRPRTC